MNHWGKFQWYTRLASVNPLYSSAIFHCLQWVLQTWSGWSRSQQSSTGDNWKVKQYRAPIEAKHTNYRIPAHWFEDKTFARKKGSWVRSPRVGTRIDTDKESGTRTKQLSIASRFLVVVWLRSIRDFNENRDTIFE